MEKNSFLQALPSNQGTSEEVPGLGRQICGRARLTPTPEKSGVGMAAFLAGGMPGKAFVVDCVRA